MKKVLKVTALSLALAFTSGLANAAENIAFINAGYLFQNHPDRKATEEKLDAEFKPQVEKLEASKKAIEEKIQAERKKIDDQVAKLEKDAKDPKQRPSELQKRQEDLYKQQAAAEEAINKLVAEHDKQAQEFQVAYDKRQAEERTKLLESIQQATDKVAKDKKYTLVLDANSVVYGDGKDITEEVLKAIPAQAK
ncbi:periplasmic chaperone for outer membrane proteins Skp [Volucribacter psittacicida]|uniref:Periplasmic chaperone for outer membrane proteins Skp n=1 Tax=Volucribacter psittacicida TaxID=203482 RepID=A0A4V2PCJ2_9PAST|nr:OmpH family outer membrane protein [Volucribacter psittacicida]TCK01416.1 periplasmic chaperone for outer membrane proteins Skp [Volucribacter psittacicida]